MYICIMHIGYVYYAIFLGCVICGQNTQKGLKKSIFLNRTIQSNVRFSAGLLFSSKMTTTTNSFKDDQGNRKIKETQPILL